MTIHWGRVAAFGFIVLATVIVLTRWPEISAFLSTMRTMGSPRSDPGTRLTGLIAFGLTLVSLLAALRIVLQGRSDR